MELGLSLGETSRQQPFGNNKKMVSQSLGFCMSLGLGNEQGQGGETSKSKDDDEEEERRDEGRRVVSGSSSSSADLPLLQLDLLPSAPVLPRNNPPSSQLGFPWSSENAGNSDAGSSGQMGVSARGFDVNLLPSTEEIDDCAAVSSPNSTVSSFQIDFSIYKGGGGSGSGSGSKRDSEAAGFNEGETERASSRASDDEDNGLTRKKLRLSKDQSAFLEESFKEHNTLNPKQKLALAKQLNLRPRQVEVWFQNRRARTKLKQTEVDCEYLKRCCETLTEENRRLQKELQELRALKTSHPYYMQLPATTLTMCPSCERVATTTNNSNNTTNTTTSATPNTTKTDTTTTTTNNSNNNNNKVTAAFPLNKPRFYPFSHAHQSAAT